jgi:hypothetical protein
MAQIGRVFRVGPSNQADAKARQLAQLALERREVPKLEDIAGGGPRDTGAGEFDFGRGKYLVRRTEALEQEPGNTGTDAVNASQTEPVGVDSRSHLGNPHEAGARRTTAAVRRGDAGRMVRFVQ